MTPEQKQRIEQIQMRTREGWQSINDQRESDYNLAQRLADIDELLSLVKSQEASCTRPTGWVSAGQRADPRRVYVDFENRECAEAFIKGIEPANGPMESAILMRSACVEKVREFANEFYPHEQEIHEALNEAADYLKEL